MKQELRDDIRFINKFMYAVQKHRVGMGNWIDAKTRAEIVPSKRSMSLYASIVSQEEEAKKITKEIISETTIWKDFFDHIKGVGECLSTSLIAEIMDIEKFPTVSSLWAYAGMIPEYVIAKCEEDHKLMMSSDKHHKTCPVLVDFDGNKCNSPITIVERVTGKSPKRKAGHHFLFNTRLKTICWKITEQMIKQGNQFYKDIYYNTKEQQANLHPDFSKGYVHNRAKRKMGKMFLSNLWEAWRLAEGLEVRIPYVVEKLGHTGYIPWLELKERFIAEKPEKKKKPVKK